MSLSIITQILTTYSYNFRNPVNIFWVVGIICTRQRRKLGRRVKNKPHASDHLAIRVSVFLITTFRINIELNIMINKIDWLGISRINIILLSLGGCKTCVKRWWNTLDTAHILWYQFGRWEYFWYYHGESLSTTKLWENQGKRKSNL